MAIVTWPVDVPDPESPVRTREVLVYDQVGEMDRGQYDSDRKYTDNIHVGDLTILLECSEFENFSKFFYNDLNNGARRFTADWLSELRFDYHSCRFTGPFNTSSLSSTLLRLTIPIEIKPELREDQAGDPDPWAPGEPPIVFSLPALYPTDLPPPTERRFQNSPKDNSTNMITMRGRVRRRARASTVTHRAFVVIILTIGQYRTFDEFYKFVISNGVGWFDADWFEGLGFPQFDYMYNFTSRGQSNSGTTITISLELLIKSRTTIKNPGFIFWPTSEFPPPPPSVPVDLTYGNFFTSIVPIFGSLLAAPFTDGGNIDTLYLMSPTTNAVDFGPIAYIPEFTSSDDNVAYTNIFR